MIGIRKVKLVQLGEMNAGQIFLTMLYHPLEAFDIIKRERDGRGKLFPAVLLLIFAGLEKYVSNFMLSFQFGKQDLGSVNLWVEVSYVMIPVILWVIADFCMTSIMDGETKMREIFITSCYCLAPYIILTPIRIAMSHILGAGESGFYYFLNSATLVWVILLLFAALLRQNNYGFFQAIGVTIMCLFFMIIFAAVVIFLFALSIQLISVVLEVIQEVERKLW